MITLSRLTQENVYHTIIIPSTNHINQVMLHSDVFPDKSQSKIVPK